MIISLTRSEKPGFVKNRNRALVVLSRAQEMLVVIGSRKIFGPNNQANNEQWNEISKVASELHPYCVSTHDQPGLACTSCPRHSNNNNNQTINFLKTKEEIFKYRFNFCTQKCSYKLPCGHQCQLNCHFQNNDEEDHKFYQCQMKCLKRCSKGHQCNDTCYICTSNKKCRPCITIIPFVFPLCQHNCQVQCHITTEPNPEFHCPHICETLLPCGHQCKGICGKCRKDEKHAPCKELVPKQFPQCDHIKLVQCCHKDDNAIICTERCQHIFEDCHHQCSGKCGECYKRGSHELCQEFVEKTFPGCDHKIKVRCYQMNDPNVTCRKQCSFIYPCGHQCPNNCHECKLNGSKHEKCEIMVQKVLPCNHTISIPCYQKDDPNIKCTKRCSFRYPCGHQCTESCLTCRKKGSKHNKCQTMVSVTLPCGHKIKVPCYKSHNRNLSCNICSNQD